MRRMKLRFVLALALGGGCAAPPPAMQCPRAEPTDGGTAVATMTTKRTSALPAPKCRPASAEEADLLKHIDESLAQSWAGGIKPSHTQLVRWLPTLHERGVVSSILATHTKGEHGPVYALTLLVRNAAGGLDAKLGFASAPCSGGDLHLLGEPIALDLQDAVIEYAYVVPIGGAPVDDLQILGSKEAAQLYGPHPRQRHRDVIVGKGSAGGPIEVLGSFDIEVDPPAENGLRRFDEMLLGSGWYALGDGAAFLGVHRTVTSVEDLCKPSARAARAAGKPFAPPELRILARLDPKSGFAVGPGTGQAFVIGIPENQPLESLGKDGAHTLRSGLSQVPDAERDVSPAKWLFGLYESADAARAHMQALKYRTGNVLSAQPPSVLKVKPDKAALRAPCDLFL